MTSTRETRRNGEPRLASIASWAVLVASFGLSASTWIALAILAGFTAEVTVDGFTARLAWLMPIAVAGYVVVALVLWMSPVPNKVTTFAKKNTYMAAGIGIVAQSAYHALLAWSSTGVIWRTVLAALVGALPPAVAGLAVHMRALIRREGGRDTTASASAAVSTDRQSTTTVGPEPTFVAPSRAVSAVPMPTPAEVAARITPPTSSVPPRSAPELDAPASVSRTRAVASQTSPHQLAAPSTDIHVSAQAAAPLATAIVSPTRLAQARDLAAQYRIEHGTPITAGRLAVRLRVTSEQAAQLLAAIDADQNTSATTVNGRHVKATR